MSGLTDSDADGLITFRDLNESANAHLVSDVNGTGYIDAGDLIHDPIWADGVDTDGNGYVDDISGYDFVADVGDPLDDHGHGTIAAGILGAIGNNGIGVAGVTWNSQIMPLRFHDGVGHGSVTDAAEAIDYAVANGAKVSNNSWGPRVGRLTQGIPKSFGRPSPMQPQRVISSSRRLETGEITTTTPVLPAIQPATTSTISSRWRQWTTTTN